VRIDVTQADIEQGVKRSSNRCPVAIALQRTTRKPWTVGITMMIETDPHLLQNPEVYYKVPIKVRQFIQGFDNPQGYYAPAVPFSFELGEGKVSSG
jgi:phospholipase C